MTAWSSLPEHFVEPFVARVALAILEAAPNERSETNAQAGTITLPDRELQIDLRELANRCAPLAPDDWAPLIADAVAGWIIAPATLPATFDESVSDQLQVRLVGGTADPTKLVSRQLAQGLVAELCLRLPNGHADVTPEAVERWGVPEGELWEKAIANLTTDDAVIDSFVVEDAVTFFHVHGEAPFIATLGLRLADLGDDLPRHGWLFMVPHRHSLWFVPVMELSHCMAGMLMLERAAEELQGTNFIPVSGLIYWTNGNRFQAVPLQGVQTGEDLTKAIIAVVRAGNAS
jgi:hypothetical protein